uniref:MFS transporter n=1 Tax=Acidisphaera sp. L21 TaxID=1641851 RepID=UPI0015769250
MSPLPRFLIFYSALFAAFGVASPFLPGLMQQDGLGPNQLGIVLAAGTAIRLLAGPLGGRLADQTGRVTTVLAGFTAASALVAFGYAPARGLLMLLMISVAHAAVLAPLSPIADALALGSSQNGQRFRYGWVRGAGSAAFIVG